MLQYPRLRQLEPYYKFVLQKPCVIDIYEEMEIDAVSQFLALAENQLCDCIRNEKRLG